MYVLGMSVCLIPCESPQGCPLRENSQENFLLLGVTWSWKPTVLYVLKSRLAPVLAYPTFPPQ